MDRGKNIGKYEGLNSSRFTLHPLRSIYASLFTVFVLLFALCSMPFAPCAMAADKLVVKDAENTTQFVVTDAGAVGVGTESPNYKLHLYGNDALNSSFAAIRYSDNIYGPYQYYVKGRLNGTAANANDFAGGLLWETVNTLSTIKPVAAIWGIVENSTNGAESGTISFLTTTNGSIPNTSMEKMRITSSGNVGIGTTNPSQKLYVVGNIYATGSVSWGSSRDIKEDIKILTVDDALNTLNGLNPVKFQYKADKGEGHIGFIAEDVPDLVANKDRKSLNPMDIVAVLTKVIQEQQKAITELSQKVNELETKSRLKGSMALVQH